MTTEQPGKRSWAAAIHDAAKLQNATLPPCTDQGMGSMIWRAVDGDRQVSLRRKLVPLSEPLNAGVEWTLWRDVDGLPSRVAVFREKVAPTEDRAAAIFAAVKGWLLDHWTLEDAGRFGAIDLHAPAEDTRAEADSPQEYWLSEERAVGIVIHPDCWRLHAKTESLTIWRSRSSGKAEDSLPLASLDRLCRWLATHWNEIAFGGDNRPVWLQTKAAAASRAFEAAKLARVADTPEIQQWWSSHAIRAADEELPNVFVERQGDDLVVSWDEAPSAARSYQIDNGAALVRASFAVPVLRRLVETRLRTLSLPQAQRESALAAVSASAAAGYAAIHSCNPAITRDWLNQHGFADKEARDFAVSGTSRHPLMGLLRSGRGTVVSEADYETVLGMLQPSDENSYLALRKFAKGINSQVDVREPWESGYRLAGLVRGSLNLSPSSHLDVEHVIRAMDIDVRDADIGDKYIRGVCVGTPAYKPLVVINQLCPEANGPSGRRITLAHEWCHLLFDRSRLRNLARFEGESPDNDRLLEMRANAFAVELLAPMASLIRPDGTVVSDDELPPLSAERQVSLAALERHADNLRRRLRKL